MIKLVQKFIFKHKQLAIANKKLWNVQIGLSVFRKILKQQEATMTELDNRLKEVSGKTGNWEEEKELKIKLAEQTEEIEGNDKLKKVGTKRKIENLEASMDNILLEIGGIKEL